LDSRYGSVFKVEEKTGKLVKTISSRGQGPAEIQLGTSIRVRNNKVFVLDSGFNGVKVFDTEGNILHEIKFTVVVGMRNIDVNEKEEIFVGRFDMEKNTLVRVYNLKGEYLRSLAPFKNVDRVSKYWYYYIRLDKTGNIYILFYLSRILAKYDGKGNQLWEVPVKNEILNKYPTGYEITGKGKSRNISMDIFGIDVTPQNNIVVGHVNGGCLYSPDGRLKYIITSEKQYNIGIFRVLENRLMNCLIFGKYFKIYPFKEE